MAYYDSIPVAHDLELAVWQDHRVRFGHVHD